MEESEFIHRNQQVYLAFPQFDPALMAIADRSEYEFSDKCGTVRGRSLRLDDGPLLKMVCFDIENSILKVDIENLQVNLAWSVCFYEGESRSGPRWILGRNYFTGSINELPPLFDKTLDQMMADLNLIDGQIAKSEGKYYS